MRTRKKSAAIQFLENLTGGSLTFGRLMESIRLCEELSQTAFAKQLQISKAHLCDIEKGRRVVSVARAAKFARVLGYSPEQFVKLAIQAELDREKLDLVVDVKRIA